MGWKGKRGGKAEGERTTFISLTDSCSSASANVFRAGRSSLFEKSSAEGVKIMWVWSQR